MSGHVNELLCKLIAYNLVVSARKMRMRGIVPDFPSEVPLLEDVLRGMVEAPVLRAAWAGPSPVLFVQDLFLFDYSCKATPGTGFIVRSSGTLS